jgi:hypothetical protein
MAVEDMELPVYEMLDIAGLEASLPVLAACYATTPPFPHIVLDDVLRPAAIDQLYEEMDDADEGGWRNYLHVNERKYANRDLLTWGPGLQAAARAFMSEPFVTFLSRLTGFDNLRPDATMDGGGLHRSFAGGFLNIHADFTAHHSSANWQRRVNLLLYLNREWRAEWGGDLELWTTDMSRCVEKIAPVGNRMVLFTTADDSYHGHPDPMTCPPGVARHSLALYYFTEEAEPHIRSTNYRGRPGDGVKAAAIYADTQALRLYDVMKRRFRLSDETASRWLGRANRVVRRSTRSTDEDGK